MSRSSTNPKVDGFFGRAKKWKAEMETLRGIILDCGLTEELKWGKPCYTAEGANVVIMAAFKEHCALIVCKGALLKDPKKILIQPGANSQSARQIRFTSVEEIEKLAATLKAYLREAIAAEKAGLKVTYKKITDFAVPEELQKKLDALPALKKAFQALTPGRQRAYLLHFSAPKQATTRESRVEKCVEQILAGKGLDDDYRSKKK
ncbi:MAG TPA: DUF1801 domain-containing protein [Chthoniobacter sp.]|nr:DUF1801 domain-containing protein [Chthoniobacter sp.]